MTDKLGLDFTSALFLGMRHQYPSMTGWTSLTTGVPAGWREPRSARWIASHVAHGQDAEAGLVARSALHALTDAMTVLPRVGDVIAIDEAAYPIATTAALVAKGRGITVRKYAHHRPHATLRDEPGKVIFVTDGWCQGCNRPAPLAALQRMAMSGNGIVVVDDSLACGILGHRRVRDTFGDGTGTPRWLGLTHERLLWVASLGKAYGAPLTVVTGDAHSVDILARYGNREHSSPPTSADLAAAAAALMDTRTLATRRTILHRHVQDVRRALGRVGVPAVGQPFPLVAVPFLDSQTALRSCRWLANLGVHLLVQRSRCRQGASLTAVLRSEHSDADIARLISAVRRLDLRNEVAS